MLDNDVEIKFTIFKDQFTPAPLKQAKAMYSQFLKAIERPKIGRKNSNNSFVGGVVVHHRKNDNVKSRSLITLDFDDIPRGIEHLFDHIADNFEYSFAMYSTHNHSEEHHKFRVIIPLAVSVDITPRKYKRLVEYICTQLLKAPFVDPSSYVISQVMHFPTCLDESNYFFDYVDEELLDVRLLIEELPDDDDVKVTTTEEWLDILGGISEGGRNIACAKLTGHLLQNNVHENVTYKIIELWNEQNNPPLSDKELNRTFESILRKEIERRSKWTL